MKRLENGGGEAAADLLANDIRDGYDFLMQHAQYEELSSTVPQHCKIESAP
uniref:hypothetical protein n=1 Tax=Ruegeria sp. PR1b TaxID=185588 RepID=UPI00146C604C|nr:hypothetical protein [Ruegeria sp. PR1b]